jgi:two-component system sensor histidine kinase RegB
MAGLLAALAYAYYKTQSDIIHPAHLSILAALALLNGLTYWRLQQSWPVTDIEYFLQLLADILGLTVLLYFSGGASNPFVSYYLVPVAISAAILPWRFTWFITGLSLFAYSLMLFFYHPLIDVQPSGHHHQDDSGFNLHILGMWFTFALSSGLITYFVVKMAEALRLQESAQGASREDELRNEQILGVATLAAGTAHELGTPLATMTVLLDELLLDAEQESATPLCEDLLLLKTQVESCSHILQGLVSTAEAHSHGQKELVAVSKYLHNILVRWQVLRPEAVYHLSMSAQCKQAILNIDPTLEQAICNLLNNAADAHPEAIDINADSNAETVVITIRDYGPGIALKVAEQMGKPFISTKGKGLGLGLFLTHATINRYGGSIELHNHQQGGTLVELRLPCHSKKDSTDRLDGGIND